jgi:hypothetical protein
MWAVRVLAILLVAVLLNILFYAVGPRYDVEAPAWLVIAFDVLFVVPLFWLLPSMRPRPGARALLAADALSKWGREGMGTFPSVDESRDRLHRAGWSVGEIASATRWQVIGSNGENQIKAEGGSQTEAWWRACEQARSVGMLAPARPVTAQPGAGHDRGAVLA